MTDYNNNTVSAYLSLSEYTAKDLMSEDVMSVIHGVSDPYKRSVYLAQLRGQAKRLGCVRDFDRTYKAYSKSISQIEQIGAGTNVTNFPSGRQQLTLSGRVQTDGGGIYIMKESAQSGTFEKEYICRTPVLPTCILKNVESNTEFIRLSIYTDGDWRDVTVDREMIASSAKIVGLAQYGVSVRSGRSAELLTEFLTDCIDSNRAAIPHSMSVTHLGWIDNSFVPYSDEVRFDGERDFRSIFDAVHEKGDFEVWKNHITELRRNIYIRMMMGAAFASPLLSKLGVLPFALHVWGGTGTGKTVGLMTAMSIWGSPASGAMVRTMNMTNNSAMATAAVLRDLPFAGDELQTIREQNGDYDKLIMTLCEGIDRGRMKYDKVNETRSWNCAFLFTGEEPITRNASGGGAKNRVIEIECTAPLVNNGNETANLVRANYGHAGRRYIEALKEANIDDIKRHYNKQLEMLSDSGTTDKQAMAMAAIMIGDFLGSAILFKGEAPLTVDDVKPFMKTTTEVDISERAYEYIRDVIAVNDNKFNPNQYGDMRGEIWGKLTSEEDIAYAYINKTVLVDLLRREGFQFDAVKSRWASSGKLVKNSQGRFNFTASVHGIKMNTIKLTLANV